MSLVGRRVNIELIDGYVFVAKTVLAEDEWSITIEFQNVPKIIPRAQIKSIQVTG